MATPVLTPPTVPVHPGRAGLAPDLVHDTVIRTSPGVEFAVGWADDTAPTAPGAERQREDT